jgi:hypothetical protein
MPALLQDKPLVWEPKLITRAAWKIKPGGMLRTATLWVSKIIKAILEYGLFDATFCSSAGCVRWGSIPWG